MDTLEWIDWISYIVGAVLAAAWSILSFRRAWKHKDSSLLFSLLTGFYACVFMSNMYYLITWVVEDYPFVISPGDLSWVGGFFFLITLAMGLLSELTPEQRKAARKYRLPALVAPAVCVAFNVAYIGIYPEIVVNYLLYGIPAVILSYYTLWLFLTGRKGGVHPHMGLYHLAVLVWIADQLIYDLFSTINYYNAYAVHVIVCSWLLTLVSTSFYFAARKGADA